MGAIALVNWPDFARAFPLRDLDDAKIFALVADLKSHHDIQFAYIEEIGPLPYRMRGPIATNKLSASYGALKMAIIGNGIDLEERSARWWQWRMGCPNRGGDKRPSYERAQELFPEIKIIHQIADALVIARLCQLEARAPGLRTPANQKWREYHADPDQRRRRGSLSPTSSSACTSNLSSCAAT